MSPAAQLHMPMVGLTPRSKEVQSKENPHSNALQSLDLDAVICQCLRAANLTHGQACALIGNGKGKTYDQSQWNDARKSGNLPFGRMLAGLPAEFWRHFNVLMADAAGQRVSSPDLRAKAMRDTVVMLAALANTIEEMTA